MLVLWRSYAPQQNVRRCKRALVPALYEGRMFALYTNGGDWMSYITLDTNPSTGATVWSCVCGDKGADTNPMLAQFAADAHLRRNKAPEVGMVCTYGIGSDRYAMRISWVSPNGKAVRFSHDGTDSRENRRAKLDEKTGRWRCRGGYSGIHIGHAEDYRDPHK